jgi:two-component system, NtrC family, sensor kinase
MQGRSLRNRITESIVTVVAATLILGSAVQGWVLLRSHRTDLQERTASLATRLAEVIREAQELTPALLNTAIQSIRAAEPSLLYVDIFMARRGELRAVASSRGTWLLRPPSVVAQATAGGRTVSGEGTTGVQGAWVAAAPIYLAAGDLGAVAVGVARDGADRRAVSLGWQLALVLAVASAACLAALTYAAERQITRPLRTLLSATQAVEQGSSVAVPDSGRQDEIGQLATGLGRLMHRMRRASEENAGLLAQVHGHTQALEAHVAEATAELTRRNEALRTAHDHLFELQRRLGRSQRLSLFGQLTAGFAHEVGTPLNSIAVHLQLLDKSPGLSQQDRSRVATILREVHRLDQVVRDRLAFARGGPRHLTPTRLETLVQSVAEFMAPVLEAHGIHGHFAVHGQTPEVWVDAAQIEDVLLSLLTNAVDAMPGGGTLAIETSVDDHEVRLRVIDSGPGIPPALRDQIFEPFFSTKPAGKGTGLGLSISQHIIQEHRGVLTVVDTPGAGATFEIRLPLNATDDSR